MRIGVSLLLIAVGAVLTFAVTASISGVDLAMVGVILMIVGAVGLIITLALSTRRRRTDVVHQTDAGYAGAAYGAPVGGRTTYVEPADRDPRL